MTITLTPEHERIIQAQLATGQFRSVDDVLEKVLAPFKPQGPSTALSLPGRLMRVLFSIV